jgi:hypothetical protein
MSENLVRAVGSATSLYDKACRALANAKSVDEVKDIRSKATAMAEYARQAKNCELEADAREIRMRQAQKETVGLAKGARALTNPSLAEQLEAVRSVCRVPADALRRANVCHTTSRAIRLSERLAAAAGTLQRLLENEKRITRGTRDG